MQSAVFIDAISKFQAIKNFLASWNAFGVIRDAEQTKRNWDGWMISYSTSKSISTGTKFNVLSSFYLFTMKIWKTNVKTKVEPFRTANCRIVISEYERKPHR